MEGLLGDVDGAAGARGTGDDLFGAQQELRVEGNVSFSPAFLLQDRDGSGSGKVARGLPTRRRSSMRHKDLTGMTFGDTFNYTRRPTLRLDVMGTLPVVTWVGERFRRWCGAESLLPRILEHHRGALHSLRLQGRNAERVADRLLMVDVPRLHRKWSIAQKMVNK